MLKTWGHLKTCREDSSKNYKETENARINHHGKFEAEQKLLRIKRERKDISALEYLLYPFVFLDE